MLAKIKDILGFHDIRIGNEPDARLHKFIGTSLPTVFPKARDNFDQYRDLLLGFGERNLSYREFVYKIRRRQQDVSEDYPPEEFDDEPSDW